MGRASRSPFRFSHKREEKKNCPKRKKRALLGGESRCGLDFKKGKEKNPLEKPAVVSEQGNHMVRPVSWVPRDNMEGVLEKSGEGPVV